MSKERADQDDEWLDDAFRRLARTGDAAVRAEIVAETDWIAVRSARRFADRGEPFDDLLQVARLGLLKAIDRFDPDRGVPFGAFATPTMIGELRRHFRDHTWGVHVPRRAKELRPAVNAAIDELSGELGRSPRAGEVAARLSVAEETVIEALEAIRAYRPAPLDLASEPASHTDDDALRDLLDRDLVLTMLERLDPRQRKVLYLRFFEELSQSQIADQIGTSQVHAGRLIAAGLRQLRNHLASTTS